MSTAISDFVHVNPRFHRSVNVLHDSSEGAARDNYVVTPLAEEMALRISGSLDDPRGDRAWSITGPYGSGKSSFALFLSDLLGPGSPKHSKARQIRSAAGVDDPNLLPVFIVGDRSRLVPAILTGLADVLHPSESRLAAQIRSDAAALSPSSVWSVVEDALDAVKAHSYGGFLLVIDELGKFLEYEALHPENGDIYALQVLAEAAARRPGEFVLVTVLHLAFSDYLEDASEVQVAEWQKIQGRFCDIPFFLPGQQMLGLIGRALETEWPDDLAARYADYLEQLLSTEAFSGVKGRAALEPLLLKCLPLHPVTALLLWPLFKSKLAQNERSLFSFLASTERLSFQEFLCESEWPSDEPPMYRVDHLCNYVSEALGTAVLLGHQARRWGEIQHVLDKLAPDCPPLTSSVVKAIGLLSLYGRETGLRATHKTLEAALGDPAGVRDALSHLQAASNIVFRRHEGAYALWEGSDVDLDASYEQALRQVSDGTPAQRLNHVMDMPPFVARAHYIRTGTLRYFTRVVIDGTAEDLAAAFSPDPLDDGADGRIIYVLSAPEARESLVARAQELGQQAPAGRGVTLFAFPRPIAGLENSVTELEAWLWVAENVPALQGDPVARQEVRARIAAARSRLGKVAGSVLGLPGFKFEPETSEWVCFGERVSRPSHRAFVRWLSDLLDQTFSEAPILRNELINREHISSAASAARRSLVQAMLTRGSEPRLGIEGAPAEATIYQSILLHGEFHRQAEQGWAFSKPSGCWRGLWSAGMVFLETTSGAPREITELYRLWRRPPYGLKSGPLPVLLTALLLACRDEVALYEQGVFVPEIRIEVLERLMRNPQDFSIRRVPLHDDAKSALELLGEALPDAGADDDLSRRLVAMARHLVTFAAKLPPYSRFTRRFDSPRVVAVRETLLRAKDPVALLLEDLPRVLECDIQDHSQRALYARRLREAVLALEGAYHSLTTEIESAVRASFGVRAQGREAGAELAKRAAPLQPYATDGRLARFIRELARDPDADWAASVGRVIADGRPAREWRDSDVVIFHARLSVLASDFTRLEELVAEKDRVGGTPILKVELLDGRYVRAETATTVPLEHETDVAELSGLLKGVLDEYGTSLGRNAEHIGVAALARTLAKKLSPKTDAEESDSA